MNSYIAGLSVIKPPEKEINSFVSSVCVSSGSTVFTGLGKSFAIAQKASSQFRSIGLKSLSFQLEELFHGELGGVRKGDIIVVVSKSGSADQLTRLRAFANENNSPLIGFLSSLDSTGVFDSVISSGVYKEIGPYPFLPTLSLTATEILLNICLLKLAECKKLNETEFYRNHPNGGIGSDLGRLARELCNKDISEIVVFDTDGSDKFYRAMGQGKRGYCLVVREKTGLFYGVITDGDIRRLAAAEERGAIQPNAAVNRTPIIVGPETPKHEVASIFRQAPGLRFIPVVENKMVLGVIERDSYGERFA
jgi:arabinose-5-phosphate isomerase